MNFFKRIFATRDVSADTKPRSVQPTSEPMPTPQTQTPPRHREVRAALEAAYADPAYLHATAVSARFVIHEAWKERFGSTPTLSAQQRTYTDALHQRATAALGSGHWNDGIELLWQVLFAMPLHYLPFDNLVIAYSSKPAPAAIVATAVTAVLACPDQGSGSVHQASVLSWLVDTLREIEGRASLDTLRHLSRLEPASVPLAWCIGSELLHRRQFSEAVAQYDSTLTLSPDFFLAEYDRGRCLKLMQRPQEAVVSFERAYKICPTDGLLAACGINAQRWAAELRGTERQS